ncbi:hypothetical protein RN001_010857 [Aquatica leii]|uniref:Uncharacterized protein n=1 Tax=Aquatica leii TaxID=1421715 RepID=A0AAN7PAA3_9COLE|nr:hypothetical protein RN001_010857 [Aquatica leii]
MDTPSIEELKKQCELMKKLESKNVEIDQLKNQSSAIKSRIASYKQEAETIKARRDSKAMHLQNRIEEIEARIKEQKEYGGELQAQRDATINRIRTEVEALRLQLEVSDNVVEDSICDSFLDDDICSQVAVRKKLLEDLHQHNVSLINERKNLESELLEISKKADLLKTELFEARELFNTLEIEAFSLHNTLNTYSNPTEQSLFDEVNDPRKVLYEKLQLLKLQFENLQKHVDIKKKQLIAMSILNFELKCVIKNHPVEYQQDFNDFIFAYQNYVKMMKDLCNIMDELVLKKVQLVEKGFPEDVASFCDNLYKQQRKFEDELHQIGRSEYRFMKFKSIDIRETNAKIRHEEAEIKRLLEKILEKEDGINETRREFECILKKDCVQDVSESCSKSLESNDNVEQPKKVEEKKVTFDEKANLNSEPTVRKGGRVLQYKTVFFPSKNKKK